MKKFVSVALATVLALAPWSAVAQSNGISVRFYWYADEFSNTIVGEIVHFCDGTSYRWGEATPYSGEEINEC
jgi:hypothetical protein